MVKSFLRRMVRPDHWEFLSWYRARLGFLPAVRAYLDLLRYGGIGRAPNTYAGNFVFLRPGTRDQDVYDEIFGAREYDIDLGDPRFIVDAGAHIGLSSVFFAGRYPKATIVAIEPEPSNFQVLLKNVRDYPNIKPIQAGLWSRKTRLQILDPNVATWSFRVVESSSGEGIPAVGVADVMAQFGATRIDVLKIDIEGSEFEVLSHGASWIGSVGTLVIELHDRLRPGCSQALETLLSGYRYSRSKSGESRVISDLTPISQPAAPVPAQTSADQEAPP